MSYCMFSMLNKSKLLLLCLICSCSGEIQMENDLERLYSNSVVLCLDSMKCMQMKETTDLRKHGLKLVVYSDSLACSACKMNEMYQWDDLLMKSKAYGKKLNIFFVFSPSFDDRLALDWLIKTYMMDYPIYVDTLGVFERNNPWFPHNPNCHTFLLDEKDSVIMVGSPLKNKKMEALFWRTVEERLGKFDEG